MFSNLSESSISLATETPSLVMRGAPKDFSITTLRPLGPSVTLTASARRSTPLSIRSRASLENLTSLAGMLFSSIQKAYEMHSRRRTIAPAGAARAACRVQNRNLRTEAAGAPCAESNWFDRQPRVLAEMNEKALARTTQSISEVPKRAAAALSGRTRSPRAPPFERPDAGQGALSGFLPC